MRGRELWRASLLLKPLLHVQPLMRAGDCVGGGEQATRAGWVKVAGQQALVGLSLGALLALGGFVRVYLTDDGNVVDAAAIALSLFTIVTTSVLAGSSLPFLLAWANIDPANAGTTVQVVMDILGVTVTCAVCYVILVLLYPPSAAAALVGVSLLQ